MDDGSWVPFAESFVDWLWVGCYKSPTLIQTFFNISKKIYKRNLFSSLYKRTGRGIQAQIQAQINVNEDLLEFQLSNKQNDDVMTFKMYSWLKQMDSCRLQVYFVPQPVFMYHVSHVFGLPLATIAFDHLELDY